VKEALSGLELRALVNELSRTISGSRLDNIYQLNGKRFLLKLRKPGMTYKLLVELGKRAHLTGQDTQVPRTPTPFCMGLRKDLRGGWVRDVRQYKLDRIVEFVIEARGSCHRLIFELFGEGNLILVGPNGKIKRVLRPKVMRDRKLLVGEDFKYPPQPQVNLEEPGKPDLSILRSLGSMEVVRGLARTTGLSGTYAEEVLLRAGIPKEKPCSSLTEEELEKLSEALSGLLRPVLEGRIEPLIVADGDDWVDVVPLRLLRYSGLREIPFQSMNEAVDAYFSRLEAQEARKKAEEGLREELEKLKKMLKAQEEALRMFKSRSELFYQIGNTIYAHLNDLNFLVDFLKEFREHKGSWEAIRNELEALRSRGPPFSWISGLDPRGPLLRLELDGLELQLDMRLSAQENASRYYEKAKKARKKAEGALKALEKTREKVREVETKLKELEKIKLLKPEVSEKHPEVGRPKKAWYEAFRWFRSSDGFLIVAGEDAVTNELLVKKHAGPGDLLLHAEIPGAPFVLVKAGGREVPESTLEEAAQVAIAYSRAWKYGLGHATAICFKPEQAKKVGPHGEKLPKGAFYIMGKKEYIRKVKPLLAIGVRTSDGKTKLLIGPVGAVKSASDAYVLVGPGDEKAEEVIQKAVRALEAKLGPLDLDKSELERLRALIPYGKGCLVSTRG